MTYPTDQPACNVPRTVVRTRVGTYSAASSVPMLYKDPIPNPERKRIAAICQYVWHHAIRPVNTEKIRTAHHTTRTRPIRSASQPASTPPIPIPTSVYVLSAPARTGDNSRSFVMLGSASASIWRSMPSTIRATKTPTLTRRPVRSKESVFTIADYASLQFAQVDLVGLDGADVLLRPSACTVQG